jgi:hypothetical protein
MNTGQVLADLDKYASEFDFRVLDNAYVEFAAARFSAFRTKIDWLIVFEVLGFSMREVEFVDNIYAYGSCVTKRGLIGEEIPFASNRETPLFNEETRQSVVDWSHWVIEMNGRQRTFAPSREEYRRAGVNINTEPGPGSLKEIELLRYLVHDLSEELFLSTERLLKMFPGCGAMPLFLQSTKWQHPDVANEEKPSQNISIRSLVESLSYRDASLFQQGRPNTHWTFWLDATAGGDAEK